MKQAVSREYHTVQDIYRCAALFTLNIWFDLFFSGVASPCKHFLLTSALRQWPLNPCSANQREFRDLAGTWLPVDCLRRNMFCCFSMFFTLLFCFCDADLRGLCCRPASLTSYSHLNFVSLFESFWKTDAPKDYRERDRVDWGGNGMERNAIECDSRLKDKHDELMIGWLRYVGVVWEMWVWPCWFRGRSCCECRKNDLQKELN